MLLEEQKYMRWLNCVVQQIEYVLKSDDIIDIIGGLQVINVPGHTPGSIAIYQTDKKLCSLVMLSGTTKKKTL